MRRLAQSCLTQSLDAMLLGDAYHSCGVTCCNIMSSHAERWDERFKMVRLSEVSNKEIPLKNL